MQESQLQLSADFLNLRSGLSIPANLFTGTSFSAAEVSPKLMIHMQMYFISFHLDNEHDNKDSIAHANKSFVFQFFEILIVK